VACSLPHQSVTWNATGRMALAAEIAFRPKHAKPTTAIAVFGGRTIVETYPLAEAAKAYERVAEGQARFRAVLTM
jgi:hypothetical protein